MKTKKDKKNTDNKIHETQGDIDKTFHYDFEMKFAEKKKSHNENNYIIYAKCLN